MVGGALYLLFQIEFIRYLAFRECLFARPLYHLVPIGKWMEEFNQDREHHFWYTHIFLFMGLTFPYLYYQQEVFGSIGLLLALADTGAAVVGGNYGTVPMPWAAPKTLAGCITFALILGIGSCFLGVPFIVILPTSVFCALAEVYSGSTDNITPVFVFITLQELMS
jgi:dolichol kinase